MWGGGPPLLPHPANAPANRKKDSLAAIVR
jgi:hypothetical protein